MSLCIPGPLLPEARREARGCSLCSLTLSGPLALRRWVCSVVLFLTTDNTTMQENFRLYHMATRDRLLPSIINPLLPPAHTHTLPHLHDLPHQHPILPCQRALKLNCSTRTLAALVFFLQQVSTKTKTTKKPTFPVDLECLLFWSFSKKRKQQQKKAPAWRPGPWCFHSCVFVWHIVRLSVRLSSPLVKETKINVFFVCLLVFLALEKQDKGIRLCSVLRKALHKTCTILHLAHVAIPTGGGDSCATHPYLS